jgi:type I restriction enzyme, S subunit
MELNPGYKQTEVGVIHGDWIAEALGPHVQIKSGESPSQFRFGNVGVPYFKVEQLNNNSKYLRDTCYFFQGDKTVPRGSLIFPKRGASILLNKVRILEQDAFMDTNLMTLTPKASLDNEYLYYALTYIELWRIADTTSIPQINNKHIIPLVVPLPALDEQRAIAKVLSDADALIDSIEQLIAKKRSLKQGAMQELLTGKKRLPGFSGVWEVKQLGELGTWKGGMTPSMQNPTFWDRGAVPWISSGDVKSVLLTETASLITDEAVKRGKTTLLPPKSIVVVTRSGILRRYLPVAMNVVAMAINQDIKALIPSVNYAPLYLLQTLIGHGERILASCVKSGTTVESIEFSWLKRFTIPLPGIEEQSAIATILSDMDAEIAALEAKLAKARQLKHGMMHNLLTGMIRLV